MTANGQPLGSPHLATGSWAPLQPRCTHLSASCTSAQPGGECGGQGPPGSPSREPALNLHEQPPKVCVQWGWGGLEVSYLVVLQPLRFVMEENWVFIGLPLDTLGLFSFWTLVFQGGEEVGRVGE